MRKNESTGRDRKEKREYRGAGGDRRGNHSGGFKKDGFRGSNRQGRGRDSRQGGRDFEESKSMNAREAAYRILEPYYFEGADFDKQVDKVFNKNIAERDRRLAYEIAVGTLRYQQYLDYIVNKYLDEKFDENEKLKIVLRIGLYQLLYLDRVPNHAAVNESVNLIKKLGEKHLSGVVNGVLRSIEKAGKSALMVGEEFSGAKKLAIEYSHPEWLIERWNEQIGTGKTKKLLKFNSQKPEIYVRRNTYKTHIQTFENGIATCTVTTPMGTGFKKLYYRLKPGIQPQNLESFKAGFCTVQAPSSGWVVAMLNLQKGDTVLDLCAAPGGKSTLAAELVGDEGYVISADLSAKRLSMVFENAMRLGLRNIYTLATDSAIPGLKGSYKRVLLDAPCSGTGVIHRHPDGRWRKSKSEIANMIKVQASLLEETAKLLAPGGVLVYSTCSIDKDENENQVEKFLKNHDEFYLESADDYVEKRFCTPKGYLKITPYDHGMDGMFAARLVKR